MAVYARIAFQLYNFLVYCVVALFCYAIVLGVLLCSLHRALLAVMLVLPELHIRFAPVAFAASLQVPSKLKWRDRLLGPNCLARVTRFAEPKPNPLWGRCGD